jgi:UDP-2,4-diacetamido-2,4,6-trideoxy-beta-L-altropyranose hydrolase
MGSSASHLTIRADAHRDIGVGHVMRCLALAQAWRELRGTVTFATHCESEPLLQRLRDECDEVVDFDLPYPADGDFDRLMELAGTAAGSPVVVDGYEFGPGYHRDIRARGHGVLIIDDNGHLETYAADWILNQNVFAAASLYERHGSDATLFMGPAYALLRREFRVHRSWVRPRTAAPPKILVTLGGSDPGNVTLAVLRGLTGLPTGSEVRVIVGHSNPHHLALTDFIQSARLPCQVCYAVDDMAQQMLWADLAISTPSVTCWELAFMQVPALLTTDADNQGSNAAQLQAMGIARDLGRADIGLSDRVAAGVREILLDDPRRWEMARRGRELIDGDGAVRVAQAIGMKSGEATRDQDVSANAASPLEEKVPAWKAKKTAS